MTTEQETQEPVLEQLVAEPIVHTFDRTDAIAAFKALITQYGASWKSNTPAEAFDQLKKCNLFLTEIDRRDILVGKVVV